LDLSSTQLSFENGKIGNIFIISCSLSDFSAFSFISDEPVANDDTAGFSFGDAAEPPAPDADAEPAPEPEADAAPGIDANAAEPGAPPEADTDAAGPPAVTEPATGEEEEAADQ
jgi:hypothetical protein